LLLINHGDTLTEYNIKNVLIHEIDILKLSEQQLVLEFAPSLHPPLQQGISGNKMASLFYGFQPEDIAEIEQAILEGCSRAN